MGNLNEKEKLEYYRADIERKMRDVYNDIEEFLVDSKERELVLIRLIEAGLWAKEAVVKYIHLHPDVDEDEM